MTVPRLVAIALIFIIAAAGWGVLAASVEYRTNSSDSALGERVEGLWGGPQWQSAPRFTYRTGAAETALELASSDITADFELDQRRKGLLWYATYEVAFAGRYGVSNPTTATTDVTMQFTFPQSDGVYDGFAVVVGDREVPVTYREGAAFATFPVSAGAAVEVQTGYATQGLDEWRYLPSPDGAGVVNDFSLRMTTDFADVDYPADAVSPGEVTTSGEGTELTWSYGSLVTGRPIGLVMPKPTNPGPLAARVSLFAPVSLLFFFASLVLLTATSGIRLHPMNYAFLAAGFFAFHLLLAYLADHIDINIAFGAGAAVSVLLCVGYLLLVMGRGRALTEIAISQFVFLVLFSYSFFFEGFTGLAITIGSVLTLGYFMIKTAKVDWADVFARSKPAAVAQAAAIPEKSSTT